MSELAIRLRGVVKRYGEITAVDGLDLEVPEGTCVGLLGPNGAGRRLPTRASSSCSGSRCQTSRSKHVRSWASRRSSTTST
jgi:ABC-type phosphate/phosphonate transport system ATPase subunit